MSAPNVSYRVEMTPEANLKIQELALKLNTSFSDVVRFAITLLDVAVEGKEKGQKIGFVSDEKKLDQEIILPGK